MKIYRYKICIITTNQTITMYSRSKDEAMSIYADYVVTSERAYIFDNDLHEYVVEEYLSTPVYSSDYECVVIPREFVLDTILRDNKKLLLTYSPIVSDKLTYEQKQNLVKLLKRQHCFGRHEIIKLCNNTTTVLDIVTNQYKNISISKA